MTRDAERWLEDVLRQAGEAATPGAPELARAFQGVKQRLRAAPTESGEGSAGAGPVAAVSRVPWPRLLPRANTPGERVRLLVWSSAVAGVGFILGMQFAGSAPAPSVPAPSVPPPIEATARPAVAPALAPTALADRAIVEGVPGAAASTLPLPLRGDAHQSGVEPPARTLDGLAPQAHAPVRTARTVRHAPSRLGFDEVLARLMRAERAQRSARPELALALLDEIDARGDALTLREERLMTRVLAACALGDTAAAEQAAEALKGARGSSIYESRLAETCVASDP